MKFHIKESDFYYLEILLSLYFCLLINMDIESSITSEDLVFKHSAIESSTILT